MLSPIFTCMSAVPEVDIKPAEDFSQCLLAVRDKLGEVRTERTEVRSGIGFSLLLLFSCCVASDFCTQGMKFLHRQHERLSLLVSASLD